MNTQHYAKFGQGFAALTLILAICVQPQAQTRTQTHTIAVKDIPALTATAPTQARLERE